MQNNTLVINSGSETLKFRVFDEQLNNVFAGRFDNKNGVHTLTIDGSGESTELAKDEDVLQKLCSLLTNIQFSKIGFRIVHGGEKFTNPTLLTQEALNELDKLSPLAPLHNPPTLELIRKFQILFPTIPVYGVFDTSFHQTLSPEEYLYGLPYEYYEKYRVRRYGFHGISHKYVSSVLRTLELQANKVVSCHLGSGSSVTAILDGKSIDTSMGFTPLEGLIMTTRPGDVDDGAISYIQQCTGLSDAQMLEIENKKSGLLGISGISFDMRTLLSAEASGNARAHLAIEMFISRAVKYIGAYIAGMNGISGLIFTAGIGAGSDQIRERICARLTYAGIKIDKSKNNGQIDVEQNLKISDNDSVPIWVIPTNEELQIAREINAYQ